MHFLFCTLISCFVLSFRIVALEQSLPLHLSDVENAIKLAVQSESNAAHCITHHSEMLKRAMDGVDPVSIV